jgi:PAZ domain/Argonaute linker 1 domain
LSKEINRPVDVGGGVEVWFGHSQSVRIGWKPLLIVDASQRAFVKPGPVHEWMAEIFNSPVGSALEQHKYKEFEKKIVTLKVTYRGKNTVNARCNGLKRPANQMTFECDGRKVTVEQYFGESYGTRLKYPHLPCLWVGDKTKNIWVPMEVMLTKETPFITLKYHFNLDMYHQRRSGISQEAHRFPDCGHDQIYGNSGSYS